MSLPTVRFAPSPTGFLHAGNLRTAIVNWLFAKQSGGRFLLRIDDTDTARSEERFIEAARTDLAWLGIVPDGEARQSERFAQYDEALARLAAAGRAYRCYESPEELDIKRKIQLSRGLPPVYDRAALNLTEADHAKFAAEGRRPHWRFRLETGSKVILDDRIQGHVELDPASLSDPVVRRADGSWLYMLPSVIDDIDMAVTHVVRGQDHLTNSAMQVQMFQALGSPVPTMAHMALLSTRGGELSKRLGAAGIGHYQSLGLEPIALSAYLGRLGTSDPIEPVTTLAPLVESFSWHKFNKANALFDEQELIALNTKIIHHMPYEAVADRLPAGADAAAWAAIHGNIETVAGFEHWWQIITGPMTPVIEDAAFIIQARQTLEALPWSPAIWKGWTDALKSQTGRKGKDLFLPLRLALTGEAHGPDMSAMVMLIGRDQVLARLTT
jgi:glutamyl-tRNA synthetase